MDLCNDKRNLILIFLTLTVYYFNIPILSLKFLEGKLEYLFISLSVPKFYNFDFQHTI